MPTSRLNCWAFILRDVEELGTGSDGLLTAERDASLLGQRPPSTPLVFHRHGAAVRQGHAVDWFHGRVPDSVYNADER